VPVWAWQIEKPRREGIEFQLARPMGRAGAINSTPGMIQVAPLPAWFE